MRHQVFALAVLAALPAWSDTHFRADKAPRPGVLSHREQCDIRLRVDGEVEVRVHKDQVSVHTVSGQDAHNDGTQCTAPLPDREAAPAFAFSTVDGRGEMRLVAPPSGENEYTALVHIRDTASGTSPYHFRLTWDDPAVAPDMHRGAHETLPLSAGPEGFSWNNVVTYKSRGEGESHLNDVTQHFSDARVDIDQSGKIMVSFTSGKKQVVYTGVVIAHDDNRIKADVLVPDHPLRGAMTLTIDGEKVNNISLDATDGQAHLRLTWARNK